MKIIYIISILTICCIISGCGKVGPLTLPKDKLDKSVISYPCDLECQKRFDDEKKRQQSVVLQSD